MDSPKRIVFQVPLPAALLKGFEAAAEYNRVSMSALARELMLKEVERVISSKRAKRIPIQKK